jgi:uncharacterized protein
VVVSEQCFDKKVKALVAKTKGVKGNLNNVVDLEAIMERGRRFNKEMRDLTMNIMNDYDLLPTNNFKYGSHPDGAIHSDLHGSFSPRAYLMVAGLAATCHAPKVLTITCSNRPLQGTKVIVDGPEYENAAAWAPTGASLTPTSSSKPTSTATPTALTPSPPGTTMMASSWNAMSGASSTRNKPAAWNSTSATRKPPWNCCTRLAGAKALARSCRPGHPPHEEYFVKEFGPTPISCRISAWKPRAWNTPSMSARNPWPSRAAYGLANKGPQHDEAWLIFMDMVNNQIPTFEDKAEALHYFPMFRTWFGLQGLCKLPWNDIEPEGNKQLEEANKVPEHVQNYVDIYNGVTGKNIDKHELIRQSERVYNFQRVFNRNTFPIHYNIRGFYSVSIILFQDLNPAILYLCKKNIMIERELLPFIGEKVFSGKTIILLGARQVGKTVLLDTLVEGRSESCMHLNADDPAVRLLLEQPNTEQLRQLIGGKSILIIDEAQQIPNIGITAKLIHDTFRDVQLILSGSSSFELASATHEPLTGRKRTFLLYPVTWSEYQNYAGYLTAEQSLENRLIFGMYPDVITQAAEQELTLRELTESYLFKDVLLYGRLKKPDEIRKLLQALAFQIGHEVSWRELGEITGLDPKTVERYIQVLEQAFIIFRLGSYSRNLRNEIKGGKKVYFYDNGVRNAVIGQLQPFALRTDKGALWENFLISERQKFNSYSQRFVSSWFWRTTQQQEVDYLEEHNGVLSAWEIKYKSGKKSRTPKTFLNAYDTSAETIHRGNFRDFISTYNMT